MEACYGKFAKIYDKLIIDDIDYASYGNTILKLCKDNKVNLNDYLDLACGTGNLTKEISEYFSCTYAVDLSEDMLSMAESKLDAFNINFICQDISKLNLNKKFDLITCSLDSVNYITNLRSLNSFFKGVYNHLKHEGIFVFDINSSYKLSKILGNNIFIHDDEEVFYTWENSYDKPRLEMYLSFFIKEGSTYTRFNEFHEERAYEEDEIDSIIFKHGFKSIKKYDDYSLKKPKEKTERITYLVKK